jgi:hypothetical protein
MLMIKEIEDLDADVQRTIEQQKEKLAELLVIFSYFNLCVCRLGTQFNL